MLARGRARRSKKGCWGKAKEWMKEWRASLAAGHLHQWEWYYGLGYLRMQRHCERRRIRGQRFVGGLGGELHEGSWSHQQPRTGHLEVDPGPFPWRTFWTFWTVVGPLGGPWTRVSMRWALSGKTVAATWTTWRLARRGGREPALET